jgi:hypothetical protein
MHQDFSGDTQVKHEYRALIYLCLYTELMSQEALLHFQDRNPEVYDMLR